MVLRSRASPISRPVTSLGHQVGRRVFWEGPTFFKLGPIHFSRGGKFLGVLLPPGYGPANIVKWSREVEPFSYMHTACVMCVFWAHASDLVTSRRFLMCLVWSAFEQKWVRAVSLMRQYRNRFCSNADHTKRIRKGCGVTKSDACAQKTHRTHAVCIYLKIP